MKKKNKKLVGEVGLQESGSEILHRAPLCQNWVLHRRFPAEGEVLHEKSFDPTEFGTLSQNEIQFTEFTHEPKI